MPFSRGSRRPIGCGCVWQRLCDGIYVLDELPDRRPLATGICRRVRRLRRQDSDDTTGTYWPSITSNSRTLNSNVEHGKSSLPRSTLFVTAIPPPALALDLDHARPRRLGLGQGDGEHAVDVASLGLAAIDGGRKD